MTDLKWRTEKRIINKLIPFEKNPRKMMEEQVKALTDSITEFDLVEIPVIDTDNTLVAGHQRMKVMQMLNRGGEETDVRVPNRKLTEQEFLHYNVRSNQNRGMFDYELLAGLFDPEELLALGFSEKELDLIDFPNLDDIAKQDEVPETPQEPKSKKGDLYELGDHRVLCGDALSVDDILKLMDGKQADLLLTDPPYNVAYTGKTKDALKIENDSMEDGKFGQFLQDAFATAFTVLKEGGVFYIWHADSEGYNFRKALHDIGAKVRQCLIWNKNSMVMGRQDYHWKHEPCLYGWKEGAGHLWNTDRKQTTVLEFDRPTENKEHPTMKPVDLLVYQVKNNTERGQIVLDPFLGSGSTLIACQREGRACYGTELDPRYVDVIVRRYVDFVENPEIKKNGQPFTWK